MADGVEFLLKLDAQLDGALKMIRTITDVEKGLGRAEAAISRTEHATRAAGEGHKKHAKDAEHLEGVFHRLIHSGMDPFLHKAKEIAEFEFIRRGVDKLLELPGELAHAVFELGAEILKTAGKAEEASIVFGALFGTEDAEKLLEYSEKIANVTGMTSEQMKSIMATLGKSGFKPGEDMERAVRAASDLGVLSGRGAAGAEDAANMLARLQSFGEIQARQLVAFGINQGDFWTELSRQTHTGVATLKKEMTAGKVDIEYTKAAIYTLLSKKTHQGLGGLTGDVGQDFNSRLTRLKNVPDRIFEAMSKSPAFSRISEFIGKLGDALNPDSAFGQNLISGIGATLGHVADAFESIDIGNVVHVITDDVIPAIKFMADNFVPVIDAIAQMIDGFRMIAKAVGVVIEGLKVVQDLSPASLLKNGAHMVLHPVDSAREMAAGGGPFGDARKGFSDLIKKLEEPMYGLGSSAGKGMSRGLQSTVRDVRSATADVGMSSINAMQSTLDSHSPSRVFEKIGEAAATGYTQGLAGSKGDVADATASMVYMPPTASRPGRSPSVNLTINVHADGGGDGKQVAETIADHLREQVPAIIAATFQKLQIEMGAA